MTVYFSSDDDKKMVVEYAEDLNARIVQDLDEIERADQVIVRWDGNSSRSRLAIDYAKTLGKPLIVTILTV